MNMRRALPLRSFAVFNSNSLTSSVSSMLVPPHEFFFAQYTIVGRFSLRESLSAMRALVNSDHVKVVFGGESILHTALQNSTSPLFNFVDEKLLGPLDYSAVEEL